MVCKKSSFLHTIFVRVFKARSKCLTSDRQTVKKGKLVRASSEVFSGREYHYERTAWRHRKGGLSMSILCVIWVKVRKGSRNRWQADWLLVLSC